MYTPRLVPYRCSVPPPTFTSWSSSASNRPQIFHTATAKRLSPGVGTGSSAVAAERTRPGPTAWTIYWPQCPTNRPGSCGAWGGEDGRGRPTKKSDNCCTGNTALHCPRAKLIGPYSGAAGGGRRRQTQSFPDLETTPAATGGGRGAERPGWGLRQNLWNFSDGRALRSRNALAAVAVDGSEGEGVCGRVPRPREGGPSPPVCGRPWAAEGLTGGWTMAGGRPARPPGPEASGGS